MYTTAACAYNWTLGILALCGRKQKEADRLMACCFAALLLSCLTRVASESILGDRILAEQLANAVTHQRSRKCSAACFWPLPCAIMLEGPYIKHLTMLKRCSALL